MNLLRRTSAGLLCGLAALLLGVSLGWLWLQGGRDAEPPRRSASPSPTGTVVESVAPRLLEGPSASRGVPAGEEESLAAAMATIRFRLVSGPLQNSVRWNLLSSVGVELNGESDVAGRLSVPPGEWRVEPASGGWRVVEDPVVRLTAGTEEVLFVDRTTTLTLFVGDAETGAPISDAFVSLSAEDLHVGLHRTDATGQCTLEGVPCEWSGRVVVSNGDYLPCYQTLPMGCEEQERMEVWLHPARSSPRIDLRVLDPVGTPLPGVEAWGHLVSSDWTVQGCLPLGISDKRGTLRARGVGNLHAIDLEGGGIWPMRLSLDAEARAKGLVSTLAAPLLCGGSLRLLDHACAGELRVTVEPRSDATLSEPLPSEFRRRPTPRGLSMDLPSGLETAVSIRCLECGARWSQPLLVREQGWRVDARLQAPAVRTVRLVPSGASISAVTRVNSHGRRLPLRRLKGSDDVEVDLPLDCRRFVAHSRDERRVVLSRASAELVPFDEVERVEADFGARAALNLEILDTEGRPVPDVGVTLVGFDRLSDGSVFYGARRAASTDGAWQQMLGNRFEVDSEAEGRPTVVLTPGTYTIQVSPLGGRDRTCFFGTPVVPSSGVVDVEEGESEVTIVVERPRPLTLRWPEPRTVPWRWWVWDPEREEGNVFQGQEASFLITEAPRALLVRDDEGQVYATVSVPGGVRPLVLDLELTADPQDQ